MWRRSSLPAVAGSAPVAGAEGAESSRPAVAFVLSGGGALGAVQAGQVAALFAAGIVPDLLVGVSVGALNAAFLAKEGVSAERVAALMRFWFGFDDRSVFPSRRHHHVSRLLLGRSHVESPVGLEAMVAEQCFTGLLEEAPVPLLVTTTDLTNGVQRVWSSGPAARVLVASSSLPGVFPPVLLDGAVHVDGGVLCALPTQVALDAGAFVVFNLDIHAGTPPRTLEGTSALSVFNASFALARRHLTERPPVVGDDQRVVSLPAPSTEGLRVNDGSQSVRLVAEARELTARFLEAEGLDGAAVAALVAEARGDVLSGVEALAAPVLEERSVSRFVADARAVLASSRQRVPVASRRRGRRVPDRSRPLERAPRR